VTTRRDGNRIYYQLASSRVAELWTALRDVAAAHQAELDTLAAAYLGDRSGLEQISRSKLVRRLEAGDVVVIDVRPTAEYKAGHISGARSIPIESLQRQLAELPDDLEVVAYCRGDFPSMPMMQCANSPPPAAEQGASRRDSPNGTKQA
jgi:hypothetical protein